MAIATQTGSGWNVPDPARLDFLPGGGTVGQVLTKRTAVDADADWEDGGVIGAIVDGSIGSVKLAPLSTSTVLGRISGGTGPVEAVPMASMPVSTAVTALLGGKQDTLVSAANIKTVNGANILGAGNIVVTGSGDALVANTLAQFAPTTSLQLSGVISDETGSGALVFASGPTLVAPVLGTPASGNLANCTGLTVAGGLAGLGANVAAFLATPSSANLAAAVSDETGTGVLVLATNPVLVTPNIGTPSAGVLTNCTGLPVAGGGTGRATGTTAYALVATGTTPTGAQQSLAAGLTTEILVGGGASALPVWTTASGSGAPVRATSPTITTPTVSGISVADGANVTTQNAMGALAVDVTKGLNTKSIAVDSTLTFSGTPATANTWFGLHLTNTDTNPHIVTMPSAFSQVTQAARTTFPIAASGQVFLTWRYDGSAYKVFGDSAFFSNFAATVAPAVTDDVAKGYGPGSLWYDATGNALYINESNGAGAAVWTQVGGGDMVLASIQTVTGAKTFNDSKLFLAGSSSGAGTLKAPAAASTYVWTMPAATTGIAALALGNVYTKAQVVTPVTLTSASNLIATDASLSNNFVVAALQENTTLSNPTNPTDGQVVNWRIKNNATGTYTVAFGTKFKHPAGTAPTHTTGASKVDRYTGVYNSTDDVWELSSVLDIR